MGGLRKKSIDESTGTRDSVPARRVIASRELLADVRVLIIEHAGEEYKLRITSKDKLILTK